MCVLGVVCRRCECVLRSECTVLLGAQYSSRFLAAMFKLQALAARAAGSRLLGAGATPVVTRTATGVGIRYDTPTLDTTHTEQKTGKGEKLHLQASGEA